MTCEICDGTRKVVVTFSRAGRYRSFVIDAPCPECDRWAYPTFKSIRESEITANT